MKWYYQCLRFVSWFCDTNRPFYKHVCNDHQLQFSKKKWVYVKLAYAVILQRCFKYLTKKMENSHCWERLDHLTINYVLFWICFITKPLIFGLDEQGIEFAIACIFCWISSNQTVHTLIFLSVISRLNPQICSSHFFHFCFSMCVDLDMSRI